MFSLGKKTRLGGVTESEHLKESETRENCEENSRGRVLLA